MDSVETANPDRQYEQFKQHVDTEKGSEPSPITVSCCVFAIFQERLRDADAEELASVARELLSAAPA